MASRDIRSHGGSLVLLNCLQSLFALETMNPGKELYIISPWISNSPIIDNRLGQVKQIFPFVRGNWVYLSDVLEACAWKGCKVRLVSDPEHTQTKEFISRLEPLIKTRRLENDHEKGLITSHYYISGSMNFTYRGINVNGEKIRITTAPHEVNQAILSARARWEEAEII